jgi:hypothetical protein
MSEQIEVIIRTSGEVATTLVASASEQNGKRGRKKSSSEIWVSQNSGVECDLGGIAKDWRYILGNRSRWTTQAVARAHVQAKCENTLAKLGIDRPQLRRLAIAGLVEVSVPYCEDGTLDAARDFPWEHLISGATKEFRGPSPLLVVRHLSGVPKTRRRTPKSFSLVQTAPGIFGEHFNLKAERSLITGGLQSLSDTGRLDNPVAADLRSEIKSEAPDVVHLAGVDVRLGEWLEADWLEDEVKFEADTKDGMYFAHSRRPYRRVNAKKIAQYLTAASKKPVLVGINSWYSGGELAPSCVANGAAMAIGFHNSFDFEVGREFFSEFYRSWLHHDLDATRAMLEAWLKIKPLAKKIRGSGITLWSANSAFERKTRGFMKPNSRGFRLAIQENEKAQDELVRTEADPETERVRDLVGWSIKPVKCLNYSMLHNRRSLMEELMFWFKKPEADEEGRQVNEIRNVEVEVMLKVGDGSFPYRTTVNLGDDNLQIDLADDTIESMGENQAGGICVPLTSELARSVDERMNTSVYVNVQWKGQILYRHTFPVVLSPVDEWNLTETESCWLPSFVQPRDPAVSDIISSAQKYLKCLLDNPTASFDGYQSQDETEVNYVVAQVKSIWSSIVYDYRLGYISPPPAYSENTQRLRTPGQVLRQKRGTCIDLTTLFVSCLEWIELYPVIFMTPVHAFAGFWKHEDYQREYVSVAVQGVTDRKENSEVVSHGGKFPWVAERGAYEELKRFVDEGKLVPVECVDLTESSGFQKTCDFASRYFDADDKYECFDPREKYDNRIKKFHSMIDIVSSRKRVTPLPIVSTNGR